MLGSTIRPGTASIRRARMVAAELHVFEEGGHGFSLHWTIGKPAAAWPSLFTTWAATHGFKA